MPQEALDRGHSASQNGEFLTQWAVDSSTYDSYEIDGVALSGADIFDVVFPNDCSNGSEDRDLTIDYIDIDGRRIQA